MDAAAGLLARGWFAAWRSWWLASAGALALVLLLVLGTAGLLDGMERETEARVADFYTSDVRVTPTRAGAAPPGTFAFANASDLQEAMGNLSRAAGGAHVEARLETTYLLSRRSLVEAYLFEEEQFGLALPGVASDRDAYSVGVVAGMTLDEDATRDRLRPYLVAGAFPSWQRSDAERNGTIPILMSSSQYHSLLNESEREALTGAPSTGDLASVRLELTAARVNDTGPYKDIIRFPARITGLFESGIDALDRVTLLAPIEDVRRLLGAPAQSAAANVLTVAGGDADGARREADGAGWVTEGSPEFTQRYLGQLVLVVRTLALGLSSLLLVFPFFMVWIGMSQQLERSRRELAVCRAIGLERRTLRGALLRLVGRLGVMALAPTVLVLGLAAWLLPGPLSASRLLPFPLGFHLPAWALWVTGANLLLASTLALAGAMRRHRGGDLATALRAF